MFNEFQKVTDEWQKVSKEGFEATLRAYGEVNKGLQTLATRVADYSKKTVEEGTRALEQLLAAKSVEQAIEIQSRYAKKAYDDYVAEMSKLGDLYVGLAREVYKPFERSVSKRAPAPAE